MGLTKRSIGKKMLDKIKSEVEKIVGTKTTIEIQDLYVGASLGGIVVNVWGGKAKHKYDNHLRFLLVEMPGCCKYLISTNTYIEKGWRRKGLSYLLQDIKAEIAKENGYTKLLCTVTADNEPELKVLKKCGWKKIDEGVNRRTTNVVQMYIREVD